MLSRCCGKLDDGLGYAPKHSHVQGFGAVVGRVTTPSNLVDKGTASANWIKGTLVIDSQTVAVGVHYGPSMLKSNLA